MELVELLTRAEITDVLLAYAHAVDRQDFDLVRRCYHVDAVDDHGRYHGDVDGLIAFFEQLGPTLSGTTHQFGPPWIRVRGDRAEVETYCLYRRAMRDHAPETAVTQGLRYLDDFERRGGRWAIAHRQVVLDWEQSGGTVPDPPSGPTWSRGAFGAADPSARMPADVPVSVSVSAEVSA